MPSLISPRFSAFGSLWTTARHALTGFAAVASIKLFAMISPIMARVEGGDLAAFKDIDPKALIGVFVGGMVGALFAAAYRWVQIFFTVQKVEVPKS